MERVLITGGTGSIGRALIRWAEGKDWAVTVYSRDEVKQGELKRLYPDHRYLLGDVRDSGALEMAMRRQDTVIHAAAYKQVPASEVNVMEAVHTNVIGSANVVNAAIRMNVRRVLGISTDKACAPINCYGQSKSLMEKLFAQGCLMGETQFNCVRYGNVLGSRGSVVPFFREQMREGGVITVTDPAMTRFWLTLNMAVDVIELGLAETERGTVLVPKLRASTMEALAFAVAPRCEVKVIGIRAGEKIHEQLIHSGEAMHTDDMGEWFRVWPAYTGQRGNLPAGFEYRSDTAPQISVGELREMVRQSEAQA